MNYTSLSKNISYALRHRPWEYELELDGEGFVPIAQLLDALNEGGKYNPPVTAADLEHIIAISDKERFKIKDGKIGALYGHSFPMRIAKEPIAPPDILYHGTSHKALDLIMDSGLKPMGRQYVHLSADTETAVTVGSRKDKSPVILKIKAGEAYGEGVTFYRGNDKVVLADYIPWKYIEIIKETDD